jgi:hypothetical protein
MIRRPLLTLALTAIAAAATSTAMAATVGASDDSFYTLPSPIPTDTHGTLLSYRSTTVNLGTGAPGVKAWNVLYKSTDSVGADNVVSGTVLVPTTSWPWYSGPRPVVLYAVGTHGLAQSCAPSRQMAAGTDYENANISAALKAGYAVLVTDYQGYITGDKSTYLAGASQGHAVLDIFNAAMGIPNVGLSNSAKVAIWGYSQGGQSAAWAGELQTSYASSMKLVGVAAGGIPGDFITTSLNLDGNLGAAFLASGVIGLANQYPTTLIIDVLASDAGKAQLDKLRGECVFQALPDFQNKKISDFTIGGFGLETLESIPQINATLADQDLGKNKIPVPLYQYHGQADEFIPLAQAVTLKQKYCALGTKVSFDLYPSEHIATQFQGAPAALSFIADRLAGKTAPNTCSNMNMPASTANPGGGNFVVTLNQWPLTASVSLKTLGQTVDMPSTSTFTADTDITAQTLKGGLSIPDFTTTIKVLGIPTKVGLKVTPAGDTTGTASLDTTGQLHIHGMAKAYISVTSLAGVNVGECKTTSPVEFPLDFDGPVSALGSGGVNFSGTTTFPTLKGCIVSSILSGLMSGSGQGYSFSVAPPAPTSN